MFLISQGGFSMALNRIPFDMIEERGTGKKLNSKFDDINTSLADMAIQLGERISPEANDNGRLQRAIDKLSTGGTLLLLAETYQISSALAWKSNINIIGKGESTILQVTSGGTNAIDLSNLSNVSVMNLQVKGVTGTGAGKGVLLNNSVNCTIENVTIDTFENQGLLIVGASTNNRIVNVRSKNTVGSPGNGGCGVILSGANVKYNFLDKIYTSGNRIGVSINGASQNELGTIVSENNTQIGFTLDGIVSGTGDGAKRNIIHSIIVINNSTSATSYYGGVYIGNGSNDNIIHSIESYNNRGHGVVISAVEGNASTKSIRNIFGKIISLLNDQDGVRVNFTDRNIFNEVIVDGNLKNGIYFNKANQSHVGTVQAFSHTDVTDGFGLKIDGSNNILSQLYSDSNRVGIQFVSGNSGNLMTSFKVQNNTTSDIDDQASTTRIGGTTFRTDDAQFTFQAARKAISNAFIIQTMKTDLSTFNNRLIINGGEDFSSITVQNAYFKMANSTLPTASSTHRGRMIRVEGATGVADGLYICEKNASDAYVWRQI